MNKQLFWLLIEQSKNRDTDTILQNLTQALSSLAEEDVQLFRGYLSAYLQNANDCIWVDMACKVINGYVSDDTGLYFVLWLIAQGEKIFYNALRDPDSLSEVQYIPFGHAEFEMLMSIGMDETVDFAVIEEILHRCNHEIESTVVYKCDKKYGAYDSFEDGMADIPNVLPMLIARADKDCFDWKGLYEF